MLEEDATHDLHTIMDIGVPDHRHKIVVSLLSYASSCCRPIMGMPIS
jgi:hypothetical protein